MNAKKTVVGFPGQTVFDLAIKHYGSVTGIFALMNDNPDVDFEQVLDGVALKIRKDLANDKNVKNHFKNRDINTY